MSLLRRLVLSLAAGLAVPPPALAWPFAAAPDEAANAVPDGVVRLQFPYRATPAPDPRGWQVTATYEASRPDQPGVKKETRKSSSCPVEIPVPFGCSTHRYQVVVARTLVLRPEWLRAAAGGGIEMRVPERLAGAGDYRLASLELPCLDRACTNHARDRPSIGFQAREGPAGDRADFIHLGADQPDGVFTASYAGLLLAPVPSEGSRARMKDAVDREQRFQARALQDAAGRWHVSPSAFTRFGRDGSRAAQPIESGLEVPVRDFPALGWARRYERVERSRTVGLDTMDDARQWHRARPEDWTGCIAIRAEQRDGPDDEDERTYCFDAGRPAFRRIQRADRGREWTDEWVELDGDRQPLFESRSVTRASGATHTQRWSRLLQETWPELAQSRPAIDLPALLREAEDVRRLIAPDFKE